MNIVSRYKKIEIKIGIRIIGNIERNKKEVIDLVKKLLDFGFEMTCCN